MDSNKITGDNSSKCKGIVYFILQCIFLMAVAGFLGYLFDTLLK